MWKTDKHLTMIERLELDRDAHGLVKTRGKKHRCNPEAEGQASQVVSFHHDLADGKEFAQAEKKVRVLRAGRQAVRPRVFLQWGGVAGSQRVCLEEKLPWMRLGCFPWKLHRRRGLIAEAC